MTLGSITDRVEVPPTAAAAFDAFAVQTEAAV